MSTKKKQTQSKKKCKQKSPNLRNKAFKFRIYPTQKQIGKLEWTLRRCKELYNAALQERRDAYKMCGVSVSYYAQNKQLPEIKEIREEYKDIHSQVLQDVLTRVDKAMDNFFRRVKNGEKAGYPRFKSGDRYESFTYTQSGFEIIKGKVNLSKIGRVKITLHREIVGIIKTCTIKREGDQWYAVFTTEYERDSSPIYHPTTRETGVDLGITSFAALSDGTFIENPRFYRNEEEKIQAAHRKIARRKKGSHRRDRAKKELSRRYRKVRNKRKDFLHKQSRKLVNENAVVVFEDLQVDNMTKRPPHQQDENGKYLPNGAAAKGGLNKSILDAGWSAFVALCTSKAEEAGCTIVKVAPHDTSQVCSDCGCVVKKDLSVRWHSCPHCGCELDRDHNAACNILIRYQKWKCPTAIPRWSAVEAPAFLHGVLHDAARTSRVLFPTSSYP